MQFTIIYFQIAVFYNRYIVKNNYEIWIFIGALAPRLFHNTNIENHTHSIILPILIFLIFEILSITLSLESISKFGKGISIGIIIHRAIDVMLYDSNVLVLWPIPDIYLALAPKIEIIPDILIFTIELLSMRFILMNIINSYLKKNNNNLYLINILNVPYKVSLYFSIISPFISILNNNLLNSIVEYIIIAYLVLIIVVLIFASNTHFNKIDNRFN